MVPLSERSEYEGGGTYVEPLGRAIALDQGCALLHPSCVRHAGHRITKGERWVLHAYSTRLVPFTLLACLYPEAPSQLLRLAISCMLSSSPHPTLAVGCSCSHPLLAYLLYLLTYFTYLPVAIHEVGHVLGLSHSEHSADVMSPFYVAAQVTLSENDAARVKALLGIE